MNDDMHTAEIPNRMLYDLIMEMKHEFKAELNEFKQETQRNFARLEAKIDKNTELISELYLRGDKLELSFSRNVLLGNSALAGIVAFFVALFTGRMMIEN